MNNGKAQTKSDSKLVSPVVPLLKRGDCGEEGSGDKLNDEEMDGEEMFGVFRHNSAIMCGRSIGGY